MPLNEENEIKGEPRTAGEKLKRELDEIASPKGISNLDYASYFEKLKGRVKAKPKAKAKAKDFADVLLRLEPEPEQEPEQIIEPAPEVIAEQEPQEIIEPEPEVIAPEPEQEPEEIIEPEPEPEIIAQEPEQEPEQIIEPEIIEPQDVSDDDIYVDEEDFAQNLNDDNLRGLSQFADVVLKLEPDEPDIIVEEPLSDVVTDTEDLSEQDETQEPQEFDELPEFEEAELKTAEQKLMEDLAAAMEGPPLSLDSDAVTEPEAEIIEEPQADSETEPESEEQEIIEPELEELPELVPEEPELEEQASKEPEHKTAEQRLMDELTAMGAELPPEAEEPEQELEDLPELEAEEQEQEPEELSELEAEEQEQEPEELSELEAEEQEPQEPEDLPELEAEEQEPEQELEELPELEAEEQEPEQELEDLPEQEQEQEQELEELSADDVNNKFMFEPEFEPEIKADDTEDFSGMNDEESNFNMNMNIEDEGEAENEPEPESEEEFAPWLTPGEGVWTPALEQENNIALEGESLNNNNSDRSGEDAQREKDMGLRERMLNRKNGGADAAANNGSNNAKGSGWIGRALMTLLLLLLVIGSGMCWWELRNLNLNLSKLAGLDNNANSGVSTETALRIQNLLSNIESQNKEIKPYEYAIEFLVDNNIVSGIAARGANGWQIVGSRRSQDTASGQYGYEFIFMRPLVR